METNALAALEAAGDSIDARVLKRAQYEAFEFELEAPGLVRVRNGSYGDEADDHTYRVNVERGVPVACECPAFQYRDGPCKHQLAVAIRRPVLHAAHAHDASQLATDGGTTHRKEATPSECPPSTTELSRPDDCACSPTFDDLPCWPCYRDVFEMPNPTPPTEEEV